MPAFTDRFIAELQAQRGHFHALFSADVCSPLEERLEPRIGASWHDLPQAGPRPSQAMYAIDGSEATRNFANASWLLVCQALLLGPDLSAPKLEVRLVPGNISNQTVDTYASRLMRWLE